MPGLKRIVTISVLFCMTLHCAGRLSVLSWIYEQRQQIAFELGLVDERPIAVCGSGYLDDGLVILQQDGASHAKPSTTFEGQQIELFFEAKLISLIPSPCLTRNEFLSSDTDDIFHAHLKAIFHPPSIA